MSPGTRKRKPQRNGGKDSPTSPYNIAAKAKQSRALQLRAAGFDFASIAQQVGYNQKAGAYRAVMAALEEASAGRAELAVHYRALMLHRLERIHLSQWQLAIGTPARGQPGTPDYAPAIPPDRKAARVLLQIYDRITMLLGLDPLKGLSPTDTPEEYAKSVRAALAEIDGAMPGASDTAIDAEYTVEKDPKR